MRSRSGLIETGGAMVEARMDDDGGGGWDKMGYGYDEDGRNIQIREKESRKQSRIAYLRSEVVYQAGEGTGAAVDDDKYGICRDSRRVFRGRKWRGDPGKDERLGRWANMGQRRA
jgi:hypothetical protein